MNPSLISEGFIVSKLVFLFSQVTIQRLGYRLNNVIKKNSEQL